MSRSIDISVRLVNGSYVTEKVNGVVAKSSTSPARAAERLAEQLWGASDLDSVERLNCTFGITGASKWRINNRAAIGGGR